ncbi:MAG: BamA/TamA family outer membrane protein [Candidatus Bruticola sp.]
MRNALGHVLSAAVLVGSFGASVPAFADSPSGNAAVNTAEPLPAAVNMGFSLEADSAAAPYVHGSQTSSLTSQTDSCEYVQPHIIQLVATDKGDTELVDSAAIASGAANSSCSTSELSTSEKDATVSTSSAVSADESKTIKTKTKSSTSELKKSKARLNKSRAARRKNKVNSTALGKHSSPEKVESAVANSDNGAVAIDSSEPIKSKTEFSAELSDKTDHVQTSSSSEPAVEAKAASSVEQESVPVSTYSASKNNGDNVSSALEENSAAAEQKVAPAADETKSQVADEGTKKAAASISPIFSGTVEAITDSSLRIFGIGANGEPLSLDFIVDANSQMAEGIKIGDSLSVYYEVSESGGFRVTSARYLSGEAPKNVFPGDIPSELLDNNDVTAKDETDTTNEADIPKVVSIEVEGNKTVSSEEILQIISTRIGDPLLEPRIRRDMQAIYDSGYYTDVRLDTRYTSDGVRVIFRVLENPVVDEIAIEGNSVVPSEKLRSLMQLETGKVLNTRTLQNDLQSINKYYNEDLGYTISPSHVTKLDFNSGKLTFTLVDGIVVKEVKVEGVTVFPQDQIASMITLKPGDLFNRNTLRDDTEKISALYDEKQYILDTIKPSVDVETGVVTVSVVEAVLQEIKLAWTGTSATKHRTKDDTVLRNIRTKPGEVMRRDRIQKDLERLNNLGLFKKVEPEVEPGSAPGQAVLVLNIEEQKTGLATVGVGYAGGGSGAVRPGITGAISYSERNLFGEGKQFSINLQRGAQIGAYSISYYDPAINSAQDSIGVSAYYNSVDDLEQQVTGADYGTYAYYDQEVYGATVTYGHPFSDDLRGFVTLRHETINLTMSGKSLYVPVGLGKGDLNAIGLSTLYDTRDDVFSPHKGSYANVALTFAGFGGDYSYNKFVVEGRHYVPLTKRSTLALRGMYGTVGNGAPASEYFYAGGTDTLRGYQDNSMFGNKVVLLNAEYRFPIGNIKMLSGAVFVDAGNAWISGYKSSELYTDAGVGLRIVFPNLGLGVIRIDYAFGKDGSRSSIGIGQSF